MKDARIHLAILFVAVAIFVAALSFGSRVSRGQSPTTQKNPRVKQTVLLTDSRNASVTGAFAEAAGRNATLQNELTWVFGNKQQRGWYLYILLIQQTIETQAGPGSSDFASAVAGWQKKVGLPATGVIDEETLRSLLFYWQSNRLKEKTYATPEQLLTAPISDFYDPARLDELRQVERTTYEAYKKMLAAAIADPALKLAHNSKGELAATEKYFKIISCFRSREYQEKLRRESPHAGSAGLAINSPHFTGHALDLYVGGDPVDTKDANRAIQVQTPAYQWLVRNAAKFGFKPYFYEPWHWEYVR
ncbi:MAG TPA: M15 family metallopeptidase [Pyrinomonadaceae bacterium]|nr:M15 family metallopeptidase [Pyrinomonadaceae bacterium]